MKIPKDVPRYHDETGEFVLITDLKLALDSDVFKKLQDKAQVAKLGREIPTVWIERQY